jgi:hypothetical protein
MRGDAHEIFTGAGRWEETKSVHHRGTESTEKTTNQERVRTEVGIVFSLTLFLSSVFVFSVPSVPLW